MTIHTIGLDAWDESDPTRPVATIDVACSAGTYVRAIARDLGERLGSAAYLGGLVRTASGPFGLADAVDLDAFRESAGHGPDAVRSLLLALDSGLEAFPVVRLSGAEREAAIRGQFIRPVAGLARDVASDATLRLVDHDGILVALGRIEGSRVVPDKVLVDVGPSRSTPLDAVDGPDVGPRAGPRSVAGTAPPPPAGDTRLIGGLDALQSEDGPLFVVVGVFDGLHRGHAYLLHSSEPRPNGAARSRRSSRSTRTRTRSSSATRRRCCATRTSGSSGWRAQASR